MKFWNGYYNGLTFIFATMRMTLVVGMVIMQGYPQLCYEYIRNFKIVGMVIIPVYPQPIILWVIKLLEWLLDQYIHNLCSYYYISIVGMVIIIPGYPQYYSCVIRRNSKLSVFSATCLVARLSLTLFSLYYALNVCRVEICLRLVLMYCFYVE